MTTQRQINKLMKPMLEDHDDLELVGNYVFLRPLRHVVRYIEFRRTRNPNQFEVWWGAVNLCETWNPHLLSWGDYIIGTKRPNPIDPEFPEYLIEVIKVWEWDDPEMPSALYKKLESESLSELREINSLEQFMTFACDPNVDPARSPLNYGALDTAIMNAALGNLDSAAEICKDLHRERGWYEMSENDANFDVVIERFCPMVQRGDVEGVAALLHDWEAATAERFGITHIWEKTPFPLERQMRDDTSGATSTSRYTGVKVDQVRAREYRLPKPSE